MTPSLHSALLNNLAVILRRVQNLLLETELPSYNPLRVTVMWAKEVYIMEVLFSKVCEPVPIETGPESCKDS